MRSIFEIKIGIGRQFNSVYDLSYYFAEGTTYIMLALVDGIYELNELFLFFV